MIGMKPCFYLQDPSAMLPAQALGANRANDTDGALHQAVKQLGLLMTWRVRVYSLPMKLM